MTDDGTMSADQIAERIARFRKADEEVPAAWKAKREVADAVRALLDVLCATDADTATLLAGAAEIQGMADRFGKEPVADEPRGIAEMAFAGMENFHDRSPLVGRANPIAPPLQFAPDPDAGFVSGMGFFGNAYEGAPGCVHGGFIAAAFDELLGMACIYSGAPGMTGTLEVSYRSPTPIRTLLRFEGRYEGRSGRKIRTRGEMYAGDRLCAEASGLFISIDREKFEDLNRLRRQRFSSEAEMTTREKNALE
jgi:acyl-coenzyme A thioesterase PaaI-like protein